MWFHPKGGGGGNCGELVGRHRVCPLEIVWGLKCVEIYCRSTTWWNMELRLAVDESAIKGDIMNILPGVRNDIISISAKSFPKDSK